MTSPQAPKPAKFIPANIPKVASDVLNYNTLGYDASDADLVARFPGLVTQRDANTTNAATQLSGPLDPTVENTFATSSLGSALNAVGGGDPMASIGGPGSAARGAVAADIDRQAQQKEDYDRQYELLMEADNPQRVFGLSGGDAVSLAINNVIGSNQSKYASYAGGVQQSNAQGAAQNQEVLAGVSLVATIAAAAI